MEEKEALRQNARSQAPLLSGTMLPSAGTSPLPSTPPPVLPHSGKTRHSHSQGPCLAWSTGSAADLFVQCQWHPQVWLYQCHFPKLYLGTDKCGPIHVDWKMQPEPAERCLGKGSLFQFQTTHTCTVNKCSGGYWSTAFMWRPKALLSSTLFVPHPHLPSPELSGHVETLDDFRLSFWKACTLQQGEDLEVF